MLKHVLKHQLNALSLLIAAPVLRHIDREEECQLISGVVAVGILPTLRLSLALTAFDPESTEGAATALLSGGASKITSENVCTSAPSPGKSRT